MEGFMDEQLLTTNEAAKYLTIKPETIRAWVYRGSLVPLKLRGWSLRFRKSELDRLLEPNDKKNK